VFQGKVPYLVIAILMFSYIDITENTCGHPQSVFQGKTTILSDCNSYVHLYLRNLKYPCPNLQDCGDDDTRNIQTSRILASTKQDGGVKIRVDRYTALLRVWVDGKYGNILLVH
jgi:hypothetical protein